MLKLRRRNGQSVVMKVGHEIIRLYVSDIEDNKAAVSIDASQNCLILRGELHLGNDDNFKPVIQYKKPRRHYAINR